MEVLVEVVHSDIPVLSSDSVPRPLRMARDSVARPEPALCPRELLLEDAVPEPDFELSLPRTGRGDVHGVLSAAEEDVRVLGKQRGGVEGSGGDVGFDDFERLAVDEL